VPIDTGPVRRLAERTGGAFFEARDARAVAGVYERIDRLEKAALREPRYRFEERFLPFVGLALALLVAGKLARATALEVLP
jgi:Ca-activated chloride channel homolog